MVENALVNHPEYPFQGKYLQVHGHKYHYLDEGKGEPVVMLHGNPSWSIYYRRLVKTLSPSYHCLVPDHIGCGLSDKPKDADYEYSLNQRVDDLESFLEQKGITENINLIMHDWGGMIGMAYAHRHPKAIKRLVLLNTSAFHLPKAKSFPWALWLCRNTMIGAFMVRRFNAFSYMATHVGCKKAKMSKGLRKSYVSPYNSWQNRIATLRFVQDIPLRKGDRGYDLISDVQNNLSQFKNTPTLICWGMKDFVFDKHFLNEWQKYLPQAQIHKFPDCGHYILEDAQDEIAELVQKFLAPTKSTQ